MILYYRNVLKKESGATYGSVYGRLEWDKPSSTITTQFPGYGNGRFGHPEQDRHLVLEKELFYKVFQEPINLSII